MKIFALLYLSGGLLLAAASPANAHQPGRFAYDTYRGDRHHAVYERRREMPRWLRQQPSFRHWYRESPYQRRRALSWARLFDIYRWESRYARRHSYDHYRRDYYADTPRDRQRRRRH